LTTRYAVQNLNQAYGYRVALAKIRVASSLSKKKKYVTPKQKAGTLAPASSDASPGITIVGREPALDGLSQGLSQCLLCHFDPTHGGSPLFAISMWRGRHSPPW